MEYKCPFCRTKYVAKQGLYNHMELHHKDELCGLTAAQVFFNARNKYQLTKGNGKSIIYGLPTKWNPVTERYEKFANDKEKAEFREICKKRMENKYGKTTLLDDPEFQKKMLANRKISGTFVWDNGIKTTYTGSFEKRFLEHLVDYFNWDNPTDIIAPGPTISYMLDGKARSHLPDFYISSLNLLINIKSKENQGFRLRQLKQELAEDEAIKDTSYNYIKIYDNDFREFDALLRKIKENGFNQLKPVYIV